MGDFANILYKQFFLRDLLGKIVPGSLALFALYLLLPQEARDAIVAPGDFSWYFEVILFALSLVFGLGLQIVAEWLGFHSAHPRPLTILFLRTSRGAKARDLFRSRGTCKTLH